MSDGPLFVWGADEHGSDVEEDPADGDPTLRSLPPPAPGLGPKSVDERVRELWMKYMRDHKIKSQGTDLESTPFAPWADVGDVQDLRPRMQFEGKPGMRKRIGPKELKGCGEIHNGNGTPKSQGRVDVSHAP
jgi:hypothetical protein